MRVRPAYRPDVNTRVAAAIIAASLGWGLAGVGVRAVFMDGATTFTVIVVRTTIATLAVLGYASVTRTPVSATAWRHGTAIGIFRIALAPSFFIASLNFISAGFEGLVITLIPIVTAALGHAFLGERLTSIQRAGLALGLLGSTLLIVSGETGIADGSGNTLIGGALALGGVIFGSVSGILSRRFAPQHDTPSLAVPMFVSGTIGVAVIGLLVGDIAPSSLTERSWLILAALGIASTLLPFVATLYASRHTSAATVSLTGYLAPIVGVVGGAALLDEVITPSIVVGGALALLGVVLVGRKRVRLPIVVD